MILSKQHAAWRALPALLLSLSAATLRAADLPPMTLSDGSTQPALATVAPAGNFALSNLDNINPFSRKLVVSIPIFEIDGGGDARHLVRALVTAHPWSVARTLTAEYAGGSRSYSAYHSVEDASFQSVKAGYGPGVMYARYGLDFDICSDNTTAVTKHVLTRFTFIRPDSGETELRNVTGSDNHSDGKPFFNTQWDASPCQAGSSVNRYKEFVSSDGSAATFLSSTDITDTHFTSWGLSDGPGGSGTFAFRNGLKYTISGSQVTQMTDRNGNTLTFGYDTNGRVTSITSRNSSQSVSIQYDLPDGPQRFYDQITYKGAGGVNRVVNVRYRRLADSKPADLTLLSEQGGDFTSSQTIDHLFPEYVINPNDQRGQNSTVFNPLVLESVELPDARKYELRYNRYGEVASLRLPTGGLFEYVHESATGQTTEGFHNFGGADPTIPPPMIARRVKERRVRPAGSGTTLLGKTLFTTVASPPSGQSGVTITDQNGSAQTLRSRIQYFYGNPLNAGVPYFYSPWRTGLPAKLIEGSPALLTTDYTWAQRASVLWYQGGQDTAPEKDPRIASELRTLDGGQSFNTEYLYDSYNNVTAKIDYPFASSTAFRRTATAYWTGSTGLPGLHLRDRVESQSVYVGNSTNLADRRFHFTNTINGANGNVTNQQRAVTSQTNISASYGYDSYGNITSYTDFRAITTTFSYTCSSLYLNTISRPLAHTITLNRDCATGRPTSAVDPNSAYTYFYYNDLLDRLTSTSGAAGSQTDFTYQDSLKQFTTQRKLDSSRSIKNVKTYNGMGWTTNDALYESPSATAETVTEHDVLGRVLKVSNAKRSADPLKFTTYTYDHLDRITSACSPDSACRSIAYSGPQETHTDEKGRSRTLQHDAAGRLTSAADAAGTASYTWDVLDNLTAVAHGVQSRTYAYDYLSRLLCASNPETKVGSTSCANLPLPSSGVDLFEYDGNGNLTKRTDSRGVIVNLSYDALNRLTQKTYPAGTETATFTHDTGCRKGAICSVATPSSTTTYGYDAELRVTSSQQTTAGQAFPFTYNYNNAGLPSTIQYPSGRTISYTYDDAGRPLTAYRTGYTYASSVSYEPDSALAQIRYGNNLYEGRCYNDRRQLNAFYVSAVTGSTCSPASFTLKITNTFVSPNNGNLASQVIADGSTTRTQQFDYDYANRVNQFVESGGLSQLYDHDAWGNRWVSSSSIPLHLATPTSQGNYANTTNRLNGVGYDNAGNIINHSVLGTFTWDAEGRLATAAPPSGPATTFTYDGHSRRVKKGNIIYVYDAFGRLAQEVNGPPPPTNITYLSPDHLGSTRLVTGGDAAPLRRLDYFPFGEQMGQGINGRPNIYGSTAFGYTDVVGQKFTSKERDPETGLDHFGARYFSSAQGRFTSPDAPFADQQPENPQSWNLYQYGYNNPLANVDLDGRSVWTKVIKVGVKAARTGDAAAAFADNVQDVSTLLNPAASPLQRIGAGVSLASELLPVSVGDVKDAGRLLGVIDDVVDAGKRVAKRGDDIKGVAKKVHGNTAGEQPAELYMKFDKEGDFRKWGISQNAGTRYTKKQLDGGRVDVVERGPRKEMLKKERSLVEAKPGPQNREPWAGKQKDEEH